jgi:DNA polymerase-1
MRSFLIDTMSFIFRAYHAMARQRGMSTRTGLPTAATYVFVNMLRKLRDDFSPQYLAAVFDVAGPTFRDQQAREISGVRRFDLKTQTFQEVEYHGYKANRKEMPPDLVQQVPYIRRALEAYRIPILESSGYEADDVIGTLACRAVEKSFPVFIVSSDKDMLQLVNDQVKVLNPPKDNLILDAAGVEAYLGVPPERVVDVMALRGDAIDNVPGAPGIGDKGSIEIIKRFGTVEQALDRADEVEKKTYRESLQNNRDNILKSKGLVTIDCNVPIAFDPEAMKLGAPDLEALRALFTEMEFNSLLKEILPVAEVSETKYSEAKSTVEVEALVRSIPVGRSARGCFGQWSALADSKPRKKTRFLSRTALRERCFLMHDPVPASAAADTRADIAISANAGEALIIPGAISGSDAWLKPILEDERHPESRFTTTNPPRTSGIKMASPLNGVRHDSMLYSYLLDPTYPAHGHSLADVALRRFNMKLSGGVAEEADVTGRLAAALRADVESNGLTQALPGN